MKQSPESFNVESTPVVDLKRSGAAGLNWDNEKTEVYLEDEGAGSAYLVNSEGDYVPISAFPFVIGRGNECDMVLNGKGISRKHVEIVFQSGRFVVNDLDSLNGLKVNGYKVARVILEEGDSIKLGEMNLVFTTNRKGHGTEALSDSAMGTSLGGAVKDKAVSGSPKSKTLTKTIVIGLLTVGTISLAGYFYQGFLKAKPNQTTVTAPTPAPSVSTERNDSAYEPAAANVAPETPVSRDSSAVKSPENASPPDSADHSVVDLEPPPTIADVVPPPTIAKSDTPVQQAATRKSVSVPVKPKALPPANKSVTKQQVAIASPKLTNTSVASTVPQPASSTNSDIKQRYMKGDVETLIAELKRTSTNSTLSAASRQTAQVKHDQLVKVFGLYNSGKQQFIEGNKSSALDSWSRFLKAEKDIIGGQKSVYTNAVTSKLIDEYVAIGNASSKSGNHHEAYRQWSKALQLGDSVAARIAIDGVHQKSKQLYRQALRLEYVNTEKAKSLWKEVTDLVPPGTEYYTKASSKLAWYDKWGA